MRRILGAVAASLLVAVAILLLSWTTYFAQLNSAAYDFTLRLAGSVQPNSPTLIVAIDEDSLARVGPWPWPRQKLARLLERIEEDGPRTIGVDLLLDDITTNDADGALSAAISKTRSIVLGARIDGTGDQQRWRWPNPQFRQSHVHLGHLHAEPDFDGISRRVSSAKAAAGVAVGAFAVEVLRAAGVSIQSPFEQTTAAAHVLLPQPFNLRFVGDAGSFEHVPAWQLLEGRAPLGKFKNKIVLIGSTAAGLGDDWFTPFGLSRQRMSGVEIHANAVETLYDGMDIRQTTDLTLLVLLFSCVFLLWLLDLRFEGRRFFVTSLLLGPLIVGAAWVLMKYFQVWLPFPPFLAAIILVTPGLEVANRMRVSRNLDGKIGRLLAAIENHERETGQPQVNRGRLPHGRQPSYRWRLDAIDFFNEELVRFLSFNTAVLASIEDVIIVSDLSGRVVYQNPAAKRLDGFSEDPPPAPEYFARLLDGQDFRDVITGIIETGDAWTESFVPGRNGKDYYHVRLSPITRTGVVFSLHDVTAQHELDQAKNDMVSLVSHELRTPLTSIRGYSDMLLKYGLVEEKGRKFLGTIVDESRRLNQLIQSFLDIAYIESGRQKLALSEFEVGPVIWDMIEVVGPVAAEKEILLEESAPADMRVRADRLLLSQALTNLVTNAIKYSPPGTTVHIGVSNGRGCVHFEIADQGCGIPAEEASKIFEKFYRRKNAETAGQSGFGLGLAFVKEVAAKHGGDVFVESDVGKGSVFKLWIPNR